MFRRIKKALIILTFSVKILQGLGQWLGGSTDDGRVVSWKPGGPLNCFTCERLFGFVFH